MTDTKVLFRFLSAASILVLLGCNAQLDVKRKAEKDSLRFVVEGPSSLTSNVCTAYTVSVENESGVIGATESALEVSLEATGSSSVHGSVGDCRTEESSSSVSIPEGAASATFYLRTAAQESVAITASATDMVSGSLTVEASVLETLGQESATSSKQVREGLSSPYAITSDGTRLILADAANNRVLIWNTVPTSLSQPADLVLGQPSFNASAANSTGSVNAASMNNPMGVYSDGTRLFVADSGNHRVLVWTTFPTANGEAADFVLGQATANASVANRGGAVSAGTLSTPMGIGGDGTLVYVADRGNHRVLSWSVAITTSGQVADRVLGQADLTEFTANRGGAVDGGTLSAPTAVWTDGSQVLVADGGNHRVLIWTAVPAVDGEAADFAVGQIDLTTSAAPTPAADQMSLPSSVIVAGAKLVVTDSAYHRVMIWDSVPGADGAAADDVLGQADFTDVTANLGGLSAATMSAPQGAASVGTKLLVADGGNHRVLVWNEVPTVSGDAADYALGQASLISNGSNASSEFHNKIDGPSATAISGDQLFVSDTLNNRVLGWTSLPIESNTSPDFVLGQSNFISVGANRDAGVAAANTLSAPRGIHIQGTRLFVADTANNRVLVWNTLPTSSGRPADYVLGQPDAATVSSGTTDSKMSGPRAVTSDGTRLFVADSGNNRVLVWNAIPTSSTAANFALGQATLNANVAGTSASGLTFPSSVVSDGVRLYIADQGNSRILGWTTMPTANGTAASLALGQSSTIATGGANAGGVSASSLDAPAGLALRGGRLYSSDLNNARILIWDELPSANATPADHVIGQTNFTTLATASTPSAFRLNQPLGLSVDDTRIFISEVANRRVLVLPIPN